MHKKGLIASPMPGWLQTLLARLAGETGIWGGEPGAALLPNHVLINAYQARHPLAPHTVPALTARLRMCPLESPWQGLPSCKPYC